MGCGLRIDVKFDCTLHLHPWWHVTWHLAIRSETTCRIIFQHKSSDMNEAQFNGFIAPLYFHSLKNPPKRVRNKLNKFRSIKEREREPVDRNQWLRRIHKKVAAARYRQRENLCSQKWINWNREPTVTPWWLRCCPPTPFCKRDDPLLPTPFAPLSSPSASSAMKPAPSFSPLATNKVSITRHP